MIEQMYVALLEAFLCVWVLDAGDQLLDVLDFASERLDGLVRALASLLLFMQSVDHELVEHVEVLTVGFGVVEAEMLVDLLKLLGVQL